MSQYERGCIPCSNCMVTVPQDKYYSVEKFGKFSHVLGPGLATGGADCLGCCITYRSVTSRVEQNLCNIRTKTKDNVFVNVVVAVQQCVMQDHVQQAIYKLSNVNGQIDSFVSDVVRSQVPKLTLDEAFEKKDDISNACQEQLSKNMQSYGYQILKALVTELQPDQEVANAMNEINKQKRLREASMMSAEADKIRIVKQAEAAADAQHLQGQGIARQRAAIIEGLKESITHGTGESLTSDRVSELLLITQYFETLRDVGASAKANTIFVPSGGGSSGDMATQIRNGMLQAGQAPGQNSM